MNIEHYLGPQYTIVESSIISESDVEITRELIVEFDGTLNDQFCVRYTVDKTIKTNKYIDVDDVWNARIALAVKNYFEPDHLLTQYEDMIKEFNDKASG